MEQGVLSLLWKTYHSVLQAPMKFIMKKTLLSELASLGHISWCGTSKPTNFSARCPKYPVFFTKVVGEIPHILVLLFVTVMLSIFVIQVDL
jgi:hypothetical protein